MPSALSGCKHGISSSLVNREVAGYGLDIRSSSCVYVLVQLGMVQAV